MEKLFKRVISDEIIKYLNTDNIIVLQGARQVGKTHILYYLQEFLTNKKELTYFIDLEDSRFSATIDAGIDSFLAFLRLAGFDLENIKAGKKKLFVFIDEIQYLEKPSSFLKLVADHHKYIQLIVSGSSSFDIKTKFSDSLAGRTVNFEIFNLSFKEFLRFKDLSYDLSIISEGYHLQKILSLYEDYVFYGGYPKVVLAGSAEMKEKYLQQIIDTYVRKDIRDLANIKDIKKFNNLLKILATQSGQLLNIAKLAKACALSQQTIENYLFILENTYILKLVSPHSSNPRVEIVKAPKIFFYDTGLAQMLWLNKIPQSIVGNILETSVFAELVKKYGRESINYWRNKKQNEIDFILNFKNQILPIEVKENFRNFKPASISFFLDKYIVNDYKVVGLRGNKTNKNCLYPWEIENL
jgi:hypothetical protein